MSDYRKQLDKLLAQMNIVISDDQADQLIDYIELLVKWNKAYNLTAVRSPEAMIIRHLADSLSILAHVSGERIIDVGSGPGLPGIPLAICKPECAVTTIDSNGKKTRFQQQVKTELGLNNLTVVQSRVEAYQPDPYDAVISRAFASLNDMLDWTAHLCADKGIFLAMKGLYPEQEISTLREGFSLQSTHVLTVPGCDAERHLLILGRA